MRDLHWIGSEAPEPFGGTGELSCQYKARYLEEDGNCTLLSPQALRESCWEDEPTRFYGRDSGLSLCHYVRFGGPHAAITPEQALVMYEGEVCLGSALIERPGLTLFEEKNR